MNIYHGITAHGGIAAGRIREAGASAPANLNRQVSFPIRSVDDTEAELERLDGAIARTAGVFSELYDKAVGEVGEHEASLFLAYQSLLRDEGLMRKVRSVIKSEKINAEYAVNQAAAYYEKLFRGMGDPLMAARADDIREVKARLVESLKEMEAGEEASGRKDETGAGRDDGTVVNNGRDTGAERTGETVVNNGRDTGAERTGETVVNRDSGAAVSRIGSGEAERAEDKEGFLYAADEILAGDFIRLNKEHLRGLILRNGSAVSHVAILAEAMDIPVLIRTELPDGLDGREAILDADNGMVCVSPDEETAAKYHLLIAHQNEQKRLLRELKNADTVTKNGRRILLLANINEAHEAEEAMENGAEGIGLFRTEFLYLSKNDFPTEEEQFKAYRSVLETMHGRDVVIRTFDLGGDKNIDYMRSFGMRGVRLAMQRTDVMRTQLKALLRASAYGKLWIMLPMVTSAEDMRFGRQMLGELTKALDRDGIPHGDVRIGAMIETPAAVILADEIAKEADFFSIGTNDLTQYTLGADRENQDVSGYFNPGHPAVMKEIEQTIRAAHDNGIPVGVCGEAAGNPVFAARFLDLGIDILSVSPSRLLPMRAAIRKM